MKFNYGATADLATRPTTALTRTNQNFTNFEAETPTLFATHNFDLKGNAIEDEDVEMRLT